MRTPGQDADGPAGYDEANESVHGDEMHGFESARGNLLDARDRNQAP